MDKKKTVTKFYRNKNSVARSVQGRVVQPEGIVQVDLTEILTGKKVGKQRFVAKGFEEVDKATAEKWLQAQGAAAAPAENKKDEGGKKQ